MSLEATPDSSAGRRAVDPRRSRQRSAITNGTKLLPGIDQRGPWIRRAKDLIAEFHSDIPEPSAAERSIIRRCAVLTVELEQLESKFAAAGSATATDLDLYVRASGSLRRLLLAIGLERRPKEISDDDRELDRIWTEAQQRVRERDDASEAEAD
jgi:hypothetical protein